MLHAFLHVAHSKASLQLAVPCFFGHPFAVVLDPQGRAFAVAIDLERDFRRLSVPLDIGQRFLCDPLERSLRVAVQSILEDHGFELDLNARPGAEFCGQSLQGGA